MTLEQLLEVEITATASKFSQEVTRAPASISVVTADEIKVHGYRTLAEILSSVRGLYTTYDRNYTYVGVRGFARPGDYNTRVLLLIDGHRLNEPTYDMAPIGTDFPLDVSLIERVEVIRGPGSSLYGTSAFFAVINVLTKSGASHAGRRLDTAVGSMATGHVTAADAQWRHDFRLRSRQHHDDDSAEQGARPAIRSLQRARPGLRRSWIRGTPPARHRPGRTHASRAIDRALLAPALDLRRRGSM
jgi:outer membrane receptor protein involved in Fe transport